jgi:hypothetical protein
MEMVFSSAYELVICICVSLMVSASGASGCKAVLSYCLKSELNPSTYLELSVALYVVNIF